MNASNYIATLEHRQGVKIACLEEIALEMGFYRPRRFRTADRRAPEELLPYLLGVLMKEKVPNEALVSVLVEM